MPITLKSDREVSLMRRAGEIVAEVHSLLAEKAAPGVTTGDLNEIAHRHITARGGTPSFLGYNGFPGSVCISVNEEIVHGIPGDRALKSGDIVSIDVGVIYRRYHGDAARTLPIGEVSQRALELIEATEGSFWAGLEYALAGNRLGQVSAAIQAFAEERGFDIVREYVGHGIGRSMHEAPQVPNYGASDSGPRLRPGMTLAIEPMLNIGGAATRQLADGWTVVTASGGLSAHYENTVLITADGPDVLTELVRSVV